MKKRFLFLISAVCLSGAMLLGAAACKEKEPTPGPDPGPDPGPSVEDTVKPVTGIDPLFVEPAGFNNEYAAAFEEEGTRYVYYTRNTESKGGGDEIVLRTSVGGAAYGEQSVVLAPSESGWDSKRVYSPSVIKGQFTYNETSYSYLMAYVGTDNPYSRDNANAQIGLAVATAPTGPFVRVGTTAAVTYDATQFSANGMVSSKGATEPSLVNFDKTNKVFLFFTLYAPNIANAARFLELDLSGDLKDFAPVPAVYGSAVVTTGSELQRGNALLGADWVYTREEGEEYGALYAIADLAAEAIRPRLSAKEKVYYAAEYEALYEMETAEKQVWEDYGTVDFRNTSVIGDEARGEGYARLFGGCFVRDAYGWTISAETIDVIVTSSPTIDTRPDDYEYCRALHCVTLTIG